MLSRPKHIYLFHAHHASLVNPSKVSSASAEEELHCFFFHYYIIFVHMDLNMTPNNVCPTLEICVPSVKFSRHLRAKILSQI